MPALGERVAKDMIAVRIGPTCGWPLLARLRNSNDGRSLGSRRTSPEIWRTLRLGAREARKVRVEGQLVFNGTFQMLKAAVAGFGLAFVPEDIAQPDLSKGRLRCVLADWCLPYSGYHLYYPSRRQQTPAFGLLVEALRYREPE